jgi:hypothetical protein
MGVRTGVVPRACGARMRHRGSLSKNATALQLGAISGIILAASNLPQQMVPLSRVRHLTVPLALVTAKSRWPIFRRTAANVPTHALLTPPLSHSLGPSTDLARITPLTAAVIFCDLAHP